MKKYYIEYMRAYAIFLVVSAHVSAAYYLRFNEIDSIDWWLANIVDSISRVAVALFLMISGAVLLGKNYNVSDFYIKRAIRLLPTFIFWSLFYILFRIYLGEDIIHIIRRGIVDGNFYYHLWYVTMFIICMVFLPFMNFFIIGRKPDQNEIKILMIILLCFFCLYWLVYVVRVIKGNDINWVYINNLYLGYILTGYFIDVYYDKLIVSNLMAIVGILSLITIGVVLNYISCSYGIINDYFILNNDGPVLFIIAVLIFYLFRKNYIYFLENKIIASISEASFGIYLLHSFFISIAALKFPSYWNRGVFYIPLTIFLTFIFSYLIITLFRKTKLGRFVC